MDRILIISKDKPQAQLITDALKAPVKVDFEENEDIGIAKFRRERYDITFIDTEILAQLTTSTTNPIAEALRFLRRFHPNAPIVAISDVHLARNTIDAVRYGAANYLLKPIQPEEVSLVVDQTMKAHRFAAELEYFKDEFWNEAASEIIVTNSPKMQKVYQQVKAAAPTASTILLTGETGVGKSLIAHLIHEHSVRKNESFVSVHCGALPENLVESELFGHEKGAFTSAIKRKLGRFEIANQGTIFLDEIGTISAGTQIKLLQVLQDSTFQRVGAENEIQVNVRVIAATNENLKDLSDRNAFRKDLYYRLNVFPIEIPPLRDRIEDLPTIVHLFIKRLNRKYLKNIVGIDDLALHALCSYPWPGNIRELENVIERAFIIETSEKIQGESIPYEIMENGGPTAVVELNSELTLTEARDRAIVDIERQYLKEVLSRTNGKIKDTAEIAGVGVRQINKLMTKHNLCREDFKNQK